MGGGLSRRLRDKGAGLDAGRVQGMVRDRLAPQLFGICTDHGGAARPGPCMRHPPAPPPPPVKIFSCCLNTNMNSLQNFEYFEYKHIV